MDMRHNRVRKWTAEKSKEAWGGKVLEERPVGPPQVRTPGRMDVIARREGVQTLIDVVVSSVATDVRREQERRAREPGRSLRTAEARKLTRYGEGVLAVAVEDTGRLGAGTMRLLRDWAECQDDLPPDVEYRRLAVELQHVVLSGTASMLQISRGVAPSLAWVR